MAGCSASLCGGVHEGAARGHAWALRLAAVINSVLIRTRYALFCYKGKEPKVSHSAVVELVRCEQ